MGQDGRASISPKTAVASLLYPSCHSFLVATKLNTQERSKEADVAFILIIIKLVRPGRHDTRMRGPATMFLGIDFQPVLNTESDE